MTGNTGGTGKTDIEIALLKKDVKTLTDAFDTSKKDVKEDFAELKTSVIGLTKEFSELKTKMVVVGGLAMGLVVILNSLPKMAQFFRAISQVQ